MSIKVPMRRSKKGKSHTNSIFMMWSLWSEIQSNPNHFSRVSQKKMLNFTDLAASVYSARESLIRKASVFRSTLRELEYQRQYSRRMLARAIRNAAKGPNTPASARSFRHTRNYYEGKITKMIEEEKLIVDDLKMLVQQCSELHDTAK